jgi:hypothetical protein
LTQVSAYASDVTVLSTGNPLPVPVDLDPPFDNAAAMAYFESLEGMYTQLDDAKVVGPTGKYDETFVVRSDLGIDRVFQDDPAGTGEIVAVDDSGNYGSSRLRRRWLRPPIRPSMVTPTLTATSIWMTGPIS